MDFDRYQILARRTQNHELSSVDKELHALHGLASEVGEIHAIFQKSYQGHPVKIEQIVDELGDLLWFAAELADRFDVRLSSVAVHNVEKLEKRYPEGFTAERSINREEYRREAK